MAEGGSSVPISKRNRRRRERGQSLVEFALTAPLLVLLLLGLIEIGNGLNSYLTVLAAGRDGARLYAQGQAGEPEVLSMIDVETERLPTDLPTSAENCGSGAGVCITQPTVGSVQAVQVKVCYDHPLIVGIPGVTGSTLRVCSKTTMRVLS